ncbi:MAG: tRNA (adenosine(37)-N6)-threonylcarbamoyltransferase complex dimerization subunit type 1 TsaB [Clostridia bacterium]|nr:tRNA (adenosine(37)-N6)-threonylcarbamoyltransferase complex dimerization subunit type 1 TsaB [Clostridia bacterium]
MKLLAIDTSGRALSAAIFAEGEVLASGGVDSGRNHSLELLPLVDDLLRHNHLTFADFDAFAATVGPGSFTGLRIGLATVKAWGQACGKPLVGVSTLDAIAATAAGGAEAADYIAPICDARRNEVYTALYRGGERLSPDRAVGPDTLARELARLNQPVLLAGDALLTYEPLLRRELKDNFRLPAQGNQLFFAAAAARLAAVQYLAGAVVEPAALLPVYLRLSEAEEKRLEAERRA